MEYITRYKGGFIAVNGEEWNILVQMREDKYSEPVDTEELTFEADEAAVLQWEARDKEEPLQGASLTLSVVSPGDRTYLDLYTVTPGAVRVLVYRGAESADNLFWAGSLDPEFYEEPYERLDQYTVTLTFSDFGALQRFKPSFNDGAHSIAEYIQDAFTQAGLADVVKIQDHTSTRFVQDGGSLLKDIYVRRENFTDEDGETLDYSEILQSLLQPLGMRMIQRSGRAAIYDINGICDIAPIATEWSSDSQTLGTDKVANMVKITFSPYGDAKVLDVELDKDNVTGGTREMIYDSMELSEETELEVEKGRGECLEGLYFYSECECKEGIVELTDERAGFFRTEPIYTDADEYGIYAVRPAYITGYATLSGFDGGIETFVPHSDNPRLPYLLGVTPPYYATAAKPPESWTKTGALFRMPGVRVPSGNNQIRITLPVLFDCRYNPFNSQAKYNGSIWCQAENGMLVEAGFIEGERYTEALKKFYNFVYVPVRILLYGDDGNTWHFVNRTLCYYRTQQGEAVPAFQHTYERCYWSTTPAEWNDCFLAYYNLEERIDDSGIGGGWKENRPICTRYIKDLPDSWSKKDAGEYIPAPPVPGTLVIEVGCGMVANTVHAENCYESCNHRYWNFLGTDMPKGLIKDNVTPNYYTVVPLENYIRWMLYKLPKVAIVDFLTGEELECDDIEYSGTVNEEALEDLDIDTICGTGAPEFAKGLYLVKDDSGALIPLKTLVREGRTDCPEQLLIGTLFSQYHDRCITLSGEMWIPSSADDVIVYRDAASPDMVFMMKGEYMDLRESTTEATLVEVRKDNWTA